VKNKYTIIFINPTPDLKLSKKKRWLEKKIVWSTIIIIGHRDALKKNSFRGVKKLLNFKRGV